MYCDFLGNVMYGCWWRLLFFFVGVILSWVKLVMILNFFVIINFKIVVIGIFDKCGFLF